MNEDFIRWNTAERNLIAEWVDLNKAYEIFSHHQDYASSYEEKRAVYLREYTALQALKWINITSKHVTEIS